MTEADVQCSLYAALLKQTSKALKTVARDAGGNRIKDWQYELLTRSIHAELSESWRNLTEFVDLCLFCPSKTTFWIKKSKYDRGEGDVPVWCWDWSRKDSIGIEIKFNRTASKDSGYSNKTKRTHVTERWKAFRRSLVRDLRRLKKYKRGWLIFVDQNSLFPSYAKWREFIDELIREANYGYAKKTLNAYYLCPKREKALSYKSYYNSF
jgi:hypothetical protein